MDEDLPLVIAAEVQIVSATQKVALLRLHTDQEPIDLGVNDSAAEAIVAVLKRFLDGTAS